MKKILKKTIVRLNLIKTCSVFFYIFRLIPIKKNKIVFVNFSGKGYGDNPKYILNYLNNRQNENIDYVWLTSNLNDKRFPKNVRRVKMFSIKSFFELATAKVWINNSRFDQFVIKRKGQFYIQTWHGGLALKKIEYDAEEKMSEYYKKVMKNDNKMIDLMLSNSTFCTNMYKRGFKYNGDILEVGSPRNDILINENSEIKNNICQKYRIDKNEKILLYAPTFRKNYDNNPYDIDFNLLKKILSETTGYKWNILIRLHPQISDASKYIKDISNYIDVTTYNDIQELIYSCDMLITDYSSTMFEAMIANKPVIIYANDISNYNNERGMYFDFSNLPFPLTKNNDELKQCIQNIKFDSIIEKYNLFKKNIGLNESGNASKIVGDLILNILRGEKNE